MSDSGLSDKPGSLISTEQRLKEAEARKGLKAKVERYWSSADAKTKMEKMAALDIRGHLMRRMETFIVKVPFEHDLGEFVIEARLMSPAEQLIFQEDIEVLQMDVEGIRQLLDSDKKIAAKAWGLLYSYAASGKIE